MNENERKNEKMKAKYEEEMKRIATVQKQLEEHIYDLKLKNQELSSM